jgi:hypothetical protein
MNEQVQAYLHAIRRRWRVARLADGVARAAAAAALVLAGAVALDVWLEPAGPGLVALALSAIVLAVAFVVLFLWPLRQRPTAVQVARFIEERCPELDDRLASVVTLPEPARAGFSQMVAAEAASHLDAIDQDRIVPRRLIARRAGLGVAAVAALGCALVVSLAPARLAFTTARLFLFPGSIQIEVTPGDARVVAGQALRVRARLLGGAADLVRSAPTLDVTAGGPIPMTADGDGYVAEVRSVTTPFRYRVVAGQAASREFSVTPLFAPRVERIDVHYRYPAFTGLRPRSEQDGGDIYAPAGTDVRVDVHADRPVASAAMVLVDGRRLDLRASEGVLSANLRVSEDGAYRVALTDGDGLLNAGDTEYFIRVMDDRPPDVRIIRPAGDQQITPLQEVAIEARADDDYGIEQFDLVYSVRGGAEQARPFPGPRGVQGRSGTQVLYAEDLGVQPGDFIAYYARARDTGRGRRSAEARSDIFFLEVKSFEEEFVAAQSQAGGGASGRQIEELVSAQKEIIIATWKLDRRSAAGASEQDIRAVARAQAELRARVEQALGRGGPSGRDPRPPLQRQVQLPGRAGQSGGGDAMRAAAEAMARAERALEATRTGEALPAEMDALNQLLKAQADVRRRQVTRQQQAGGGNGFGRQSQDLSALFDRELQRQQQTNYETRSRAEQRPPDTASEALDKVRELARRQDELSRQQRDLANSGLSAEELKRQLERLTREQTDLRQQAEELSRQLGQQGDGRQGEGRQSAGRQGDGRQGGSPAAGGRSGRAGGGQTDSRMRDISEEMRSAASDLRRQDLNAASNRSGRAAEKLRELERQLNDSSPDGRRRALGDLQLEARQIADEQRRLASELERVAGAGNDGDARRRIAAEKERLADRADGLEQGARRLAGSGADGERAALDEALAEMQRQQIGRRLRESAERVRDEGQARKPGGQPDTRAAAERQLAQGIDRVADKLGAAAGLPGDDEARQLSEQLARARDTRDRLQELGRQLEGNPRPGNGPQRGESARGQGAGQGGAGADRARLMEEYQRQLREAQDLLDQIRRDTPDAGTGGSTPEQHQWSAGAPGTEAFKQDFAKWESLRKSVTLALERSEAVLSQRLAEKLTQDRLNMGAGDGMPESYRRLVARYFQSLAKKK